jgi:hypothetical protein
MVEGVLEVLQVLGITVSESQRNPAAAAADF